MTVDCTIRDLSDSGADVHIPSMVFLTAPIALIIPTRDVAYSARVVWEKDGEIGLAFADALNLRSPTTNTEKMAHRLWVERRAR